MAKRKSKKCETSAPIIYRGEVIIKKVDKSGKVKSISRHNSGQAGLFTFLTKSLQGTTLNMYRPQLLMAYSDDAYTDEVFINKVTYTGTPQLFLGTSKATGDLSDGILYTFMIPFGTIKSGKTVIKGLQFYNDLPEAVVCAKVNNLNEEIETGTNLVVYWKMSFSNQ